VVGDWREASLTRMWRKPIPLLVAAVVNCPILIVKGATKPVKKILLCDSGAGKSSVLSRFILQLADLLEGEEEVTVLHVMSQISAGPGVRGKELRASADELIRERTLEGKLLDYDLHVLTHPGLRPYPKIRHGLVVDEILTEARSENYDLLVIGAHDTQSMKRLLLENLAEEILQKIDRPILIVR
jgi:nucleotide-binding universal stress UspA family protein